MIPGRTCACMHVRARGKSLKRKTVFFRIFFFKPNPKRERGASSDAPYL